MSGRGRRLAAASTAAAAGIVLAGGDAHADPRTVEVTLVTGETIVVTVDVPAGTPVDDVRIPTITTPVASVRERVDPPAPAPEPDAAPSEPRRDQGAKRRAKRRRPPVSRVITLPAPVIEPKRRPRPIAPEELAPATSAPGFSLALPGPARIGVPDFVIDRFRIPPFLLPIYQAAGTEYSVPWELLAAINEIETDYGRNLNVSSAGALGWMQFMPATWKAYGVDANADGVKDPYNPVDAIFSAARYLRASGAERDIPRAVFAYNHADWYVDSVLLRARVIGGLPADLVGSLTGLTQGRFPVRASASYADARTGRHAIEIHARAGSPVLAVQDGRVVKISRSRRLGRFLQLRDVYGNTYTYGHLGRVAASTPRLRRGDGRVVAAARPLRRGTRVAGGTILGRLGAVRAGASPRLTFLIRPAGKDAPLIDPKPIVDGWKLLESTALYRAAGRNALWGPDGQAPTIGQILLMGKEALQRSVLRDPNIDIYPCGRLDISTGRIDRRVLATLKFLSASGLKPTVSSLQCGHGYYTRSGNVSEHSSGSAIDIPRVNGIPILGHQGPGSITDVTIRRLLTLQGVMEPHQIISLMTYLNASNTIAMGDHADHIHVGFRPLLGSRDALELNGALAPEQWTRLVDRLEAIPNPAVSLGRSDER